MWEVSVLAHYQLKVEHSERKVVRALLLQKYPDTEAVYEFDQEDLLTFDIREESGQIWIKSFYANSKLLKILFETNKNLTLLGCSYPAQIASVVPNSVKFDFGVEKVGYLLPHLIPSNRLEFSGYSKTGERFEMKLSLTQQRR